MENKNEQNTSCHAVKRACASQVFHAKRLDFKVCLACSNYLSLICLTPWRQPARRMHSDKPPVARILQTASEFRHAASRCHALKGFVSGQRYPTPRPDGSIQRIMSHELSVSPPSNLWVAALSASPLRGSRLREAGRDLGREPSFRKHLQKVSPCCFLRFCCVRTFLEGSLRAVDHKKRFTGSHTPYIAMPNSLRTPLFTAVF